MRDINHVVLVGRLTRDAELKYTNSGMAISKFSVAVNRSRKQGDQWVDEVSFFDITLWGKPAEAINQYLVKGKQVAIDGELRQSRWEQDGQTRSKVEVHANNVQLLGGTGSGGNSGGGAARGGSYDSGRGGSPAAGGSDGFGDESDSFDDDIPF